MITIHKVVTQGSILSLLLFFIYLNDIPIQVMFLNFLRFAVDTTLHCCIEDMDWKNKEFRIKHELQHMQYRLKAND